jgi:hypothetical protein
MRLLLKFMVVSLLCRLGLTCDAGQLCCTDTSVPVRCIGSHPNVQIGIKPWELPDCPPANYDFSTSPDYSVDCTITESTLCIYGKTCFYHSSDGQQTFCEANIPRYQISYSQRSCTETYCVIDCIYPDLDFTLVTSVECNTPRRSFCPNLRPTARPTHNPTARPTARPTAIPTTARPTARPTLTPTAIPTTARPTTGPTPTPSAIPTKAPTSKPFYPPLQLTPTGTLPPLQVAPQPCFLC